MIRQLSTIAWMESLAASRLRWIRLLGVAFALLAAAAAYAAGAAGEMTSSDGFARTTMTLVPMALVLAPLAAIVLGVSGQSAEPGSEACVFTQPVTRGTVIVGRWVGEALALAAAIGGGLGGAALLIGINSGVEGLAGFVFFTVATIALGWIFLAIAAAIAAATEKRATALGAATFAWFFFVLLYDGVALSLAGWLTGSMGGKMLFASVFGNPADLVRVVVLLVAGTPNVLGAAGDAWMRFLGGATSAFASAVVALAGWTIAPLALAAYLVNRRDL